VAREARRYAESIVETVREPLLVMDENLKIISANKNFYTTFKVIPGKTIGSFIYDLGNKQWDIPKLRELLEDILPKKEAFDGFEVAHKFQDIGQKIMLLNARQIYRKDIDSKIILLAIEDITERRLSEEKLLLAAIVESSKDAIIGKSLDGIITSWNKGAEKIYGYTKSEIIGKSISVLIPPELPDEMIEILSKIKLGEGIENYETVRQRKDGQDIYVSITVSVVHDAEGRISGASTITRDITERKQLEKRLSDSEEQYRLLFETANDGIVLIEKNEGKIAHINPSVEKMLGYSAREIIGNKLQDIGLIIDNGDFQITMKNLNERGILRYYDVPVKTKSGQDIYADTYLVDKAKFAQCNIRDITERKRAEAELRESEERFRTMFRGHDAIMFLIDQKTGAIRDANLAATRFYGYSKERLCQMTIQEINTLPAEEVAHQRTLATEEKRNYFIFPHRLASGEVRNVEVHSSPIITRNETILFSVIHDITDRMLAEEKIHEVTERLQLATVSAKAGVWDWNLQTNEMKWDDRMLELYGLTRENFRGGIEAWEKGLHPDDSSRATEECQAALHGERDFDTDFRVLHPDGVVVNVKANGLVLRDEEGKPLRMIGLNTDITDRKQTEEKLKDTLESLRKAVSATIQVMASAVEIRDPYTAGHHIRSAGLANAIATDMGLSHEKIEGIRMAASIHDIGKLSLPAEILSKPTKLSEIEFSLIKAHSLSGYEILKNVESPWPLAEIVYQHHERTDGSGYPRNLKGNDILMEARILIVADVVEAMASHRPYRPALGIDAALEEIEKNKGILYDEAVVDVCLSLFREKGFKMEVT